MVILHTIPVILRRMGQQLQCIRSVTQTNAPNLEFVEPMQLRITADALGLRPPPQEAIGLLKKQTPDALNRQ